MRKLIAAVFAMMVAALGVQYFDAAAPAAVRLATPQASTAASQLEIAYRERRSDLQVTGSGVVDRVLADDISGDRHQRFIIELPTGQTVLIAHNIDLAPRIPGIAVGEAVEFFGEYEWNAQGGVVHWTHRDPGGRHVAGWLRHNGRIYQ